MYRSLVSTCLVDGRVCGGRVRTSAGAQGCGVDQAELVDVTQIFGTSFAGHDDEDNRIAAGTAVTGTTEAASDRVAEPRTKRATPRSGWMSCCSGPGTGTDTD
jgi:hypothetical protein